MRRARLAWETSFTMTILMANHQGNSIFCDAPSGSLTLFSKALPSEMTAKRPQWLSRSVKLFIARMISSCRNGLMHSSPMLSMS
jgi:hypothetical protein